MEAKVVSIRGRGTFTCGPFFQLIVLDFFVYACLAAPASEINKSVRSSIRTGCRMERGNWFCKQRGCTKAILWKARSMDRVRGQALMTWSTWGNIKKIGDMVCQCVCVRICGASKKATGRCWR